MAEGSPPSSKSPVRLIVMSRALAGVTQFSGLEHHDGGWQGVLSISVAGVVLGLKVQIEERRDERKAADAKARGWIYIVAGSPEEAARKIELAHHEIDRYLAAHIRTH